LDCGRGGKTWFGSEFEAYLSKLVEDVFEDFENLILANEF